MKYVNENRPIRRIITNKFEVVLQKIVIDNSFFENAQSFLLIVSISDSPYPPTPTIITLIKLFRKSITTVNYFQLIHTD
jgi:hypothetical protein